MGVGWTKEKAVAKDLIRLQWKLSLKDTITKKVKIQVGATLVLAVLATAAMRNFDKAANIHQMEQAGLDYDACRV